MPVNHGTYAVQIPGTFSGWQSIRWWTSLPKAKTDARKIAKSEGTTTRVMNKNTGEVYAEFSSTGVRRKNPVTAVSRDGWIPAHAVRIVGDQIQLMTEGRVSNPQKKKFKSFVAKVRRALSK